ncbi:hypothetical protein FUA26_10585 [Seonamhaeicola algicola]|uniref:DUF5683 domain-containing protein n=1 Tax=Seonamhaeicola algicola TaxID=1719036 RepID=A0A5C7ATV8_9FLAO|nr:DUF5683 domain-containing protein [Seonamhaeicola algicola]TXE09925.1 hypothetical protein FUA26_10585 [Seonamhaeicola algicola]
MLNKSLIVSVLAFLFCFSLVAQEEKEKKSKRKKISKEIVVDSVITREPIDPLSPSKAAFYSAILPGLGQIYNKKYWKAPIVWGALGTGIYFYTSNNKEYNRYRDAYKRRLAGFSDDEFLSVAPDGTITERVTTEGLERAQKFYRRNKEISLLVTIGIYALNIIDANVDAHLLQYNVDENLSLAPHYKFNEFDGKSNAGLTLNFKF